MVWCIGLAVLAIAGLLYWLLIITEGTYLGVRVVTLLYDWVAHRYDRIKNLNFVHEARFIGLPLADALADIPRPRVLDVATGTGRAPLALLREPEFVGTVLGVDRSIWMLSEARAVLTPSDGRVACLCADAGRLPFAAGSFDGVICLEALEFTTAPAQVVREMLRVLSPGGLLLLSNRVGADAWFYPGRLCGRGRLERFLRESGLESITTQRWQMHYDLVWAHKPSVSAPPETQQA